MSRNLTDILRVTDDDRRRAAALSGLPEATV
jgi:hypothetical protein